MIKNNLETSKIFLNPIEESMLPSLKTYRNKYDTRRWCRQIGLLSDFDQNRWYKKINNDPTIKMFGIVEDLSGYLIGVCGLTSIDFINRHAEFSCYIEPDFRLRGYSEDALYLLFGFGFGELNLNLIWGETFEHNPARKLFAKIGMIEEGIRRDFYYKEGEYINAVLISIKKSEFIKRYLHEN